MAREDARSLLRGTAGRPCSFSKATRSRNPCVFPWVLLLAALALPARVAGQGGFGLTIVPRAGIALSPNQLGRLIPRGGGGYTVFEAIGFFPRVGAVVQRTHGTSPWMLRGTVLRSMGATVHTWPECAAEICAFPGTPGSTDVTVTTATLGLGRVLSTADGQARAFASLAAGFRRYALADVPKDLNGLALHLGAGTELDWRGVSFLLEL